MITLETSRLTLRQWTLDDFEPFASVAADPQVMRFISADGKPMSRFGAWQGLTSIVGHWTLRGFGQFAVIERSSGNFVGRLGPWYPEGWPDFEIGWALRSEYWGKGYATEGASKCIEYAFSELNREHLVSLIVPENARSIRVAERLGERLERKITLPHLPPEREVLQYGLTRTEWERTRRSD
jgi:RimJ/RimL family protein N-acetyltransferase